MVSSLVIFLVEESIITDLKRMSVTLYGAGFYQVAKIQYFFSKPITSLHAVIYTE